MVFFFYLGNFFSKFIFIWKFKKLNKNFFIFWKKFGCLSMFYAVQFVKHFTFITLGGPIHMVGIHVTTFINYFWNQIEFFLTQQQIMLLSLNLESLFRYLRDKSHIFFTVKYVSWYFTIFAKKLTPIFYQKNPSKENQ